MIAKISVLESLYQADNESGSQEIEIAIQQCAMAGSSGFFNREYNDVMRDGKKHNSKR